MKNSSRKHSNLFPVIMQLCAVALLGLAVGWSTTRYLHIARNASALFAILLLFLAHFFSIALHEGGHCLFGLLSGYRFLSFRIGSLILLKTSSGFRLGRY